MVKPSRAIRPDESTSIAPLGDLDPLVQRLDGVVVLDRHRGLGDDRAGVDAGVDDEERAPVTFTPYASASAGPCIPGNDGDSAGWVLTNRPPNGARNVARRPAS